MSALWTCAAGFLLDAVAGDPVWLYHPVRIIGKWIELLERGLRRLAGQDSRRLYVAGILLWFCVVIPSVGVPFFVLRLAEQVHPYLAAALSVFWCYQLLAAKSLKVESEKVFDKLKMYDLEGARKAVSMIVGRDTQCLTEEGVTKAAIETVAENTSDGVIAPLLYLLIGGAPLGFLYKAVNTMDSMIGYKNETYLYLGRFAARMDDLFNYIPARISALLMIISAWILQMDAKNAWKIYRRDRKKHASPNAAQTEAVCAGALRVQLAGDAYYFGTLYPKETIGDPLREVEAYDIVRANHLMEGTALLTLLIFGFIKYIR